jgi:hypothetical protein
MKFGAAFIRLLASSLPYILHLPINTSHTFLKLADQLTETKRNE